MEEVKTIHHELPKTRDETPWWAKLLQSGLWLGIIGGAIFLLCASGALPFIRSALSWIPALIPSTIKTTAKLDAETIAAGDVPVEQVRRIEAAKSDPRYKRQLAAHLANIKTLPEATK